MYELISRQCCACAGGGLGCSSAAQPTFFTNGRLLAIPLQQDAGAVLPATLRCEQQAAAAALRWIPAAPAAAVGPCTPPEQACCGALRGCCPDK